MITKPDQNLLVRAARVLQANAKRLQRLYGTDWNADKDAKQAKRDFDRLLKEERDLRALIKRLAKPAPAPAPAPAPQP